MIEDASVQVSSLVAEKVMTKIMSKLKFKGKVGSRRMTRNVLLRVIDVGKNLLSPTSKKIPTGEAPGNARYQIPGRSCILPKKKETI